MSGMARLRTAVIGLGRMGMHHVRACHDVTGVELVAVLDHKPDWAVQVGAETQSLVAADLESLVGKIDIAVVAVPTADHCETAAFLLREGISCLVEKPIALTESDAEDMIAAAEHGGAVLQIGHVERFNPAVIELFSHLSPTNPIQHMAVRRHNAFSERPYDVDAVLDLMIHDLDLMALMPVGDVTEVTIDDGAHHHKVAARLNCETETVVQLSVDRQADSPQRDLKLETPTGTLTLDFVEQRLARQNPSGSEDLPIERGDALRLQLAAFVDAAQSGECSGATGSDGLNALRLANRIRNAAGLI